MPAPSPAVAPAAQWDRSLDALVLIVEDEAEITDIIAAYLEREGLRTLRAIDGPGALDLHRSARPDLVLLDVQLPGLDGWSVLSQLRQRGDTPVIMLTALDQDLDKLTALRMGADDYVVKPFNPAEVAARVRSVLRRTLRGSRPDAAPVLRVGQLVIDLGTHAVHVEGEGYSHELLLTLTEFKLLHCMALAPTRIFSRSELMHDCLPESEALERTVDSHVSKLRRKLDDVGLPNVPASVRGVGYRLMADR
ncbi:MAG: Transcriptional regulatory protein SrrA [Stenotrophomonas maltophilia]|uniref:Transcriptional regulatory protein SrrA n=1 Tax=Stenotrophomonas maltophilia TaxID=40324 RepID=A0A7V8FJS5_STEMA|nr:MAG: Transcriptional regulatory protein SrrA [Stenotrophomonas maltophilia]